MAEELKYQLRVYLRDDFAEAVRNDPQCRALEPVMRVLKSHNASLICQFDAFADYVRVAEQEGIERYPLYRWTKDTIENPVKAAKYKKAFTVYVGGEEVYEKEKMDAVSKALGHFMQAGLISRMSRHDTNPARNPQPPKHLR